ncbi:hypothetical protein BST61_g11461 [Cercospora zeina]
MAAKSTPFGKPNELSPQQILSTKLAALLHKPNDFSRPFSAPETRSLDTCLRSDCNNRLGPAPKGRIAERLLDLLRFVQIENVDGFQYALARLGSLASCGTHRAAVEKTGVPQEWINGEAWKAAMEVVGSHKGHCEKNEQAHDNKTRISGSDSGSVPYCSSPSSPNAPWTPISAMSANDPQRPFDLSSPPFWTPVWEPTSAMETFPDNVFGSPAPIGVAATAPPEVSDVTGKRKRSSQEDSTEDEQQSVRSALASADSAVVPSSNHSSVRLVESQAAAAASTEPGLTTASADHQELHQQALIMLNSVAGFGSLDELQQYQQPGYCNDVVHRLWQYHFGHASAETRKSMMRLLYKSANLAQ